MLTGIGGSTRLAITPARGEIVPGRESIQEPERNAAGALAFTGRDVVQISDRSEQRAPGAAGAQGHPVGAVPDCPLCDSAATQNKVRTDAVADSVAGTATGREIDSIRGQHQLSEAELKEVAELKKRDREVRQHENAHRAAAGQYARGMNLILEQGPEGRSYAVGGEVTIDTSEISGDPEATIAKARQIRSAAQAPSNPSAQDRQVAAQASKMEAEAQAEKMRETQAARNGAEADDGAVTGYTGVGRVPRPVIAYGVSSESIGDLLNQMV